MGLSGLCPSLVNCALVVHVQPILVARARLGTWMGWASSLGIVITPPRPKEGGPLVPGWLLLHHVVSVRSEILTEKLGKEVEGGCWRIQEIVNKNKWFFIET